MSLLGVVRRRFEDSVLRHNAKITGCGLVTFNCKTRARPQSVHFSNITGHRPVKISIHALAGVPVHVVVRHEIMSDGQECGVCRRSNLNCECRGEFAETELLAGDIRLAFREDRRDTMQIAAKQGSEYLRGWHECWTHLMITIAAMAEERHDDSV